MSDDGDLRLGLVENIKWQNGMMAELAHELRQMQLIMMCAEDESPGTPDRVQIMRRADNYRYLWESEYHPAVRGCKEHE